jgi:hypothetical protein
MAKSKKRSETASTDRSTQSAVITPDEGANGQHTDMGAHARDRIAVRAYELYLARGGADGGDFDDWLAAERELIGSNTREGSDRDE